MVHSVGIRHSVPKLFLKPIFWTIFRIYLERYGSIWNGLKFYRQKFHSKQNYLVFLSYLALSLPNFVVIHVRSSPAFFYEANKYRNMFYRHISEGGWPFSTSARKCRSLQLPVYKIHFLLEQHNV